MKIEHPEEFECERCGVVHEEGGAWREIVKGQTDEVDGAETVGKRYDDLCAKCQAEIDVLANNGFRPVRKKREKKEGLK